MTKITEIDKYAFPSKQKVDGIGPRVLLRTSETEYRPRKRTTADDWWWGFLFVFIVGMMLLGAWLLSHPEPAHAEVRSAKDCMTNECVISIVCAGGTNYSNVAEICHD